MISSLPSFLIKLKYKGANRSIANRANCAGFPSRSDAGRGNTVLLVPDSISTQFDLHQLFIGTWPIKIDLVDGYTHTAGVGDAPLNLLTVDLQVAQADAGTNVRCRSS